MVAAVAFVVAVVAAIIVVHFKQQNSSASFSKLETRSNLIVQPVS
jgi:hypothetical protein